MKGYEERGRRRRTQEPTLGGKWKAMKGDKWRETRRQRQPSSPKWRSWRETYEGRQGNSGSQQQPRMEIMQGDKWREMKGDNAAAASWPFSDFGDQHGSHWEVITPMASSYLGNYDLLCLSNNYVSLFLRFPCHRSLALAACAILFCHTGRWVPHECARWAVPKASFT